MSKIILSLIFVSFLLASCSDEVIEKAELSSESKAVLASYFIDLTTEEITDNIKNGMSGPVSISSIDSDMFAVNGVNTYCLSGYAELLDQETTLPCKDSEEVVDVKYTLCSEAAIREVFEAFNNNHYIARIEILAEKACKLIVPVCKEEDELIVKGNMLYEYNPTEEQNMDSVSKDETLRAERTKMTGDITISTGNIKDFNCKYEVLIDGDINEPTNVEFDLCGKDMEALEDEFDKIDEEGGFDKDFCTLVFE